jgi:preprotein translocase subunit YajC
MNTRSLLLSALIAGALMGTLANLPVLNFFNCFLCMWIWLGGIFAIYLYNRYERNRTQTAEASASVGQGAGIGAVAGLIGVVVGAVVFAVTSFITTPIMAQLATLLDIDMGGQQLEFLPLFGVFLCTNIFLYPIFGAVGGLLGAGVFWKKPKV